MIAGSPGDAGSTPIGIWRIAHHAIAGDERRRKHSRQQAIEGRRATRAASDAEHGEEVARVRIAAAGEVLSDGSDDHRDGDEAQGDRTPAA